MDASARLARGGVALVVTALLTAACTTGPDTSSLDPPDASGSPSASATATPPDVTDPQVQQRAVRHAVVTLRRYLHEWVSHGPVRAGRFLVPGERPHDDTGMPRLVSGTVESYEVYRWTGPAAFTLAVSLDLRFDGDALAWNQGANDRFVTVSRHPSGRYLLHFATGP